MKRSKETKRKLIEAVGYVIKTEGLDKVNYSKVARRAGVDRKNIHTYFENLDGLIEAYITENDYWLSFAEVLREVATENAPQGIRDVIIAILQNQFRYFYEEKEMQDLILWEISHDSPMMQSIHRAREAYGQRLLEMADVDFNGTNIDIRAISALLVSGIYYVVLHARFNGGMISDIDINSAHGQEAILNALKQIVGWAFQEAEKQKPK